MAEKKATTKAAPKKRTKKPATLTDVVKALAAIDETLMGILQAIQNIEGPRG